MNGTLRSLAVDLSLVLGTSMWCACTYADGRSAYHDETGVVRMPLTTGSSSGFTYRLRKANFAVSGPSELKFSSEEYLDQSTAQFELVTGDYTIALSGDWSIEREFGGEFQSVSAELLSPNPTGFHVAENVTTNIAFRFRAGDEIVRLGTGQLQVGIEVEEGDGGVAPRRRILDSIDGGDLINWTSIGGTGNPIVSYDEVLSPYDGSIAIRATGVGTTFAECGNKALLRRVHLGTIAKSDSSRVWAYIALTSDRSYYNMPKVAISLLRDSSAVGRIEFYRADTTGEYNLNELRKWSQVVRELGPDSYQALPLDKLATPDGATPVGVVEFDEVEIQLWNYLCEGHNSVTIDSVSLEY